MAAYEKWQEAISQNISESSVPGFKKTEVAFSVMDGGATMGGANANSNDPSRNAMPAASPSISFAQGNLTHSDNDLDFAIQGDGFFAIKQPNGQEAYTRDGQFHLSPTKQLVTASGMPVMGDNGPITLPQGAGAVSINGEGMITQGDQQIARLSAYNFKDNTKLGRAGDGLLVPSSSAAAPTKMAKASILNNYLEGSNVTPVREMVDLVSVSRAYEASQKIVQTADEDQGKAIDILGNP